MESFQFGDTPEMADELLDLVLSGRKTATCHAAGKEPIPTVGMQSTVKDSSGKDRVVIETTEVSIKNFNDVDADFARDEGEGDLSLDYWRKVHEDFFRREGDYADDMELVCERFKVVKVLD